MHNLKKKNKKLYCHAEKVWARRIGRESSPRRKPSSHLTFTLKTTKFSRQLISSVSQKKKKKKKETVICVPQSNLLAVIKKKKKLTQYNNCTTTPHIKVAPSTWDSLTLM
jgi:hypothetical protein